MLLVSVATPKVHNVQDLALSGNDATLSVVAMNASDKPMKLWRDWCSWGYYNVTLEFYDEHAVGGAKTWMVGKADRVWRKNYPDAAEVAAGGSVIFTVSLTSLKDTDFLAKYDGKKIKMRVHYAIPADADTKQNGVWTGRVHSMYQEYTIRK